MKIRNRLLAVAPILSGLAVLLLCCSLPARATTVSGTVKLPDGTLVNGTIEFILSQQATTITPPVLYAPVKTTCAVSAGAITSCTVQGNDTLDPAGTFYKVRIVDQRNIIVLPETKYTISGASVDLGTLPPTATATLVPPTGSVTGNMNVTGNLTVGGSMTAAGATTQVQFNNAGVMAGDPELTFTPATNTLTTDTQVVGKWNNIPAIDGLKYPCSNVGLNAAAGELPSTGGTVDARGCLGTPTIAATVTLSYASKPITWLFDRATNWQCTITNGTACWNAPAATAGFSIVFFGEAQPNVSARSFSLSNSANVSSVVNIATFQFSIEGLQIAGNSLATVTDSVVKLTNTLQTSSLKGLAIGGFANTTLLKITQTAGGAVGPFNIYNPSLDCQAVTGCKPLLVQAVASGAIMTGINFYGGSYTHPGSGGNAIIDLQGITGNDCGGVSLFGPQLESSNTTDIGIRVNNCSQVSIYSPVYTQAAAIGADAVKISGTNTDAVLVVNLHNFNLWTNNINDTVTPRVITSTDNRVPLYIYRAVGKTHGIDAMGKIRTTAQFESTVVTGTAPLVVASTTNVANLNASSLSGATFAAPGPIGSTTPAAGTFAPLTVNTSVLQGTGLKHGRVTTGSIGAGLSAAVTLTWGGSAFADTNYTPDCSVIEATASTVTLRVHHIESVTTTTIVVRIVNDDGAAAKTGTLTCMAMRD